MRPASIRTATISTGRMTRSPPTTASFAPAAPPPANPIGPAAEPTEEDPARAQGKEHGPEDQELYHPLVLLPLGPGV